jgi:predicted TIM-barrel fold metal-dependent hydrolase
MIVDADCHISPYPDPPALTADGLVGLLDENGVDRALCWLKPPYRRDLKESNRTVHEAAEKYPERIIGFGWANPRLGLETALGDVDICLKEYGFAGVKLNGAQEEYLIDDEEMVIPVVERIAELGGVLAFHCGADAYEYTHPFRVAKVAARFPDLKILLAHMGGVGVPNLHRATIESAEQHPNMYLIASAAQSQAVLKAIDVLGAERVCYGTDTPFALMHVELARFGALLRDRTDRERGLVMGGSLLRILGLQ